MKTLFGIRSNIAFVAVGLLYLIISLNTTIYGFKFFKEIDRNREDYAGDGYLLINTETELFNYCSLIISLSCLLSSILFILGVIEKRHGLLRLWLIVNIVFESILTGSLFYLIFLLIQVHNSSWYNVCGLLLAIFINAIAIAFQKYLWNGAYALYKNFHQESRRLYRVLT